MFNLMGAVLFYLGPSVLIVSAKYYAANPGLPIGYMEISIPFLMWVLAGCFFELDGLEYE